jgi:uncharacterized membrane protein YuzA (DUF378 family)
MLVVVGGLNWGLVGVFDFNLVTTIFGEAPVVEVSEGGVSDAEVAAGGPSGLARVVYIVVGLAALYIIAMSVVCCKKEGVCSKSTAASEPPAVSESESAGQGEGTTD